MKVPVELVIGIPARNEEAVIHDCLAGVRRAIRQARRHMLVDSVAVVVVAHRCGDDTAFVARRALRRYGIRGEVLVDDEAPNVARVRDRAVRRGLALLGRNDAAWIFSTDADTVVGADWISRTLAIAWRRKADCVVGLAVLDAWRGSAGGLRAYNRLLEEKLHRGSAGDEHDHVYGANLAFTAPAYLAVGGFPNTPLGEDQQLVDTIAAAGYRVARTCDSAVATSGRTHGRAEGGLADLLRRLDNPDQEAAFVLSNEPAEPSHHPVPQSHDTPTPLIQSPVRPVSRARLT